MYYYDALHDNGLSLMSIKFAGMASFHFVIIPWHYYNYYANKIEILLDFIKCCKVKEGKFLRGSTGATICQLLIICMLALTSDLFSVFSPKLMMQHDDAIVCDSLTYNNCINN